MSQAYTMPSVLKGPYCLGNYYCLQKFASCLQDQAHFTHSSASCQINLLLMNIVLAPVIEPEPSRA